MTPERMLYDALERIGRIREGRIAVHLHLSRLRARNRDDSRIRIAFRMFETMVDNFHGQLFLLTNNDMILVCKDARVADLDVIVDKLRALFAKDPLTYSEAETGVDRFVSYFDLESEYEDFVAVSARLVEEAKQRIADRRKQVPIKPLEASGLVGVMSRLGTIDIAAIIRRQACVRFTDKNHAETDFQEFYISLGDLRRAVAPDVDITGNRWLFQHLSQILDQRILAALQQAGFRKMPAAFSLNLNMATVETPAFKEFAASLAGRSKLLVEFQLIDIFNDPDRFIRARDWLRNHGHKSVLDSMTATTLEFIDAELYETDFVKLLWSEEMGDEQIAADTAETLAPVGFDRVILGHCDNENAVVWGLNQGVRHFQGRFLDTVVAAVTMNQCPKSAACTLAQCNQRHAVISGRPRAECGDNDMLDLFPTLKAF
ncbi:hypothetical protein [Magnetospirillum sp. UT-4]|uniref:hypothetical protein n=1 Tax=Magnetospirillum sp. UT-4 TaxID=2681467 RepID=UPI0020C26B04|nr:hypothetical protein [Magnetospirillum sp. UT-4]